METQNWVMYACGNMTRKMALREYKNFKLSRIKKLNNQLNDINKKESNYYEICLQIAIVCPLCKVAKRTRVCTRLAYI